MNMILTGQRRRGALLLEVVVALAVLVTAMGLLGAQLCTALRTTSYAEDQLRASQVADYVLALIEFDTETQGLLFTEEEEVEYEFPDAGADELSYWRLQEQFPGYFWRVKVAPAEPQQPETGVRLVTIEILYQPDAEQRDDIDSARVVQQLAFLRVDPPKIDLSQLTGQITGVLDGSGDGGDGSGGSLLDQLPAELVAQLPALLAMLDGFELDQISFQQLASMVDEQTLQMLMPIIQQLVGQFGGQVQQGGDLQGLMGQFTTQMGGAGLPGMGSGQPPGGRRGGGDGGEGGPAERGDGGAGRGPGGGQRGGGMTIEDLLRMRDEMQRGEGR